MAINKLTPKLSLDGIWRGAYGEDCGSPVRFADVAHLPEIEAAVPGTMESDMEKAGVLPEIYRGENVLLTQDVENFHYCLSRTFDYEPGDTDDVLVFEGLDCFADIFIDGVKIGENNNMLVSGEFKQKPEFAKYNRVEIPEEEAYAANCIWVNGTVIVPEGYPAVEKAVRDLGYRVLLVDTSEYRKVDGGLSCLSLRF